MSFSDRLSVVLLLSVVCLSVRLTVCNLFTFTSSSPEPLVLSQPLAQNILVRRKFMFVQMKDHALFRGDLVAKTYWHHLKIFSRTTRALLTKLGAKYLWVNGIYVQTKGFIIFQEYILASLNQPACIYIALFKHLNLLVKYFPCDRCGF